MFRYGNEENPTAKKEVMKKSFGIIGAGNIAKTVARHLIKAGHPVILSNSKGPDTIKEIVSSLGSGRFAGYIVVS